jgi:hypothetical protein
LRPHGEIRQAILKAASDLAVWADGARRGPTLQELAAHAKVGSVSARTMVQHLTRAGALEKVAERKVDYRNKPVAEYAPKQTSPEEAAALDDVERVMSLWIHR